MARTGRGEATRGSLRLEPGTLGAALLAHEEHARRRGALQPIPTACELVEEAGIAFVVRVVANLERKSRVAAESRRTGTNPFLPYDEDLFVAEVSETHVCLLNKFNVLDHHLLIVTRAFEDQETLLTRADFAALWACLDEVEGLGFYNAGTVAGASQPHKHLQLVSLPLGPGPRRIPIEPALEAAGFAGTVGRVPSLPFLHALARLQGVPAHAPAEAAEVAHATYLALLSAVGLEPAARPPRPYNLMVTREWMLVVPRTLPAWEGIEVNALGFAGSLLVRSRRELRRVQERGPIAILRHVAAQSDGTGGPGRNP